MVMVEILTAKLPWDGHPTKVAMEVGLCEPTRHMGRLRVLCGIGAERLQTEASTGDTAKN